MLPGASWPYIWKASLGFSDIQSSFSKVFHVSNGRGEASLDHSICCHCLGTSPLDRAVADWRTSWGLSSSKGFPMKLSCCKSELTSLDTYQPLSLWGNIQSLSLRRVWDTRAAQVWILCGFSLQISGQFRISAFQNHPSQSGLEFVPLLLGATWSHVSGVRGGARIFLMHPRGTKIAAIFSFLGGPLGSCDSGFGDQQILLKLYSAPVCWMVSCQLDAY